MVGKYRRYEVRAALTLVQLRQLANWLDVQIPLMERSALLERDAVMSSLKLLRGGIDLAAEEGGVDL